MPLEWKDEFSVGVTEIDDQHKILIKTLGSLVKYIGVPKKYKKVKETFGILAEYAHTHFATEEKYFKKFKYEFMEEHISSHRYFTNKVSELKEKFSSDKYAVTYELIDFLEDWLIGHIKGEDRKYMKFMRENGVN